MGGSGPSPFSNAFYVPAINSLRYNTSQYGSVVPVLWGTHRVGVNLIDATGFTGGGGGKGGKGGGGGGGGGGKKGNNATYSVDVAFGLCEGPASFTGASALAGGGANIIWANGGISQGLSAVDLNGYSGSQGQSADGVFAGLSAGRGFTDPYPGYSETAYVTGTPMQLGQTPAIPSIQFQVGGFQRGTAGSSFPDDARPDAIASDLLTNSAYGAGFPAGNLADVSAFGTFCQAEGIAVSLLCDRQDSAARWLSQLLDATASAAVFSGSELKILPYFSEAITAYGVTFTPDLTAIYSLTDDDFLDWENASGPSRGGARRDPIEITRKDPAEQPNWVSMEYDPAVYWYNREILGAFDEAAVAQYGLRLRPSLSGHFFTNSASASASAQLQLKRGIYNLNQYRFRLPISKCLVEPLDILEISETISGLSAWPVRVTAVEEDEENTLVVTAEDLFQYNGGVTLLYGSGNNNNPVPMDPWADPSSTNPPVIFEAPVALTNGQNEAWIAASGGDRWGGCEVWISLDGSSYAFAGMIRRKARQGILTAAFPLGSDPDTTDTLSVDLSESEGALSSGTQAEADAFVTLCWVDGELIAYETATATSPQYHYNLGTYIRRGCYGTAIGSHALGAQFARIDAAVFKYPFPYNFVPQTFYVKLPAFNLHGTKVEELSAVTAYTYTTTGAGGPVASLRGHFSGMPAAGQFIYQHTFEYKRTVPAGFAGSVAAVQSPPTGNVTCPIRRNGLWVGSLFFAGGAPSVGTPVLGSTAGGTLAARQILVQRTILGAWGESGPSDVATESLAADTLATSDAATNASATGWNLYAAEVPSGTLPDPVVTLTLQNATPIAIGTGWTEPAGGLTATGKEAPQFQQGTWNGNNAVTFEPGDVLTIEAPGTQDATFGNVSWTILAWKGAL